MTNNKTLPLFHPITLLVTCLWVGKIRFASGTWGSLFATLCFVLLLVMPQVHGLFGPETLLPLIVCIAAGSFFIGVWASNIYVSRTGKKDPGEIVIDEFAGQFTAFSVAGIGYYILLTIDPARFERLIIPTFALYIPALFLLFRLFDIWKPWIIGKADKMEGGMGVMLDDILAGLFAGLAFFLLLAIALNTIGLARLEEISQSALSGISALTQMVVE